MQKKLIFIVLDGLGDIRSEKFGNKTPLENENLKSLNSLAKNGITGLVKVTNVAPESNSAVLTLLGYPAELHGSRGPLEAIGIGVDFKDGMLALRCNFATADGNKIIDRRAGRTLTSEEALKLAKAINKNVKLANGSFVFKASVAHRAILIIKSNKRLSANITNTDPAYRMINGIAEALKEYPKIVLSSEALEKSAEISAELLNEFTKKSQEVLEGHIINRRREKKGKLKANVILSRDAGSEAPKLYNISKKWKKKWAILADMPLEIGIGKLAGMSPVNLSLPTFTKIDFPVRVKRTINALKRYDCLYIHIKGPDLFGHDGDFEGKKESVEEIDRYFFEPLLKKISLRENIIVVTGDHATPCIMKSHSADPVPILIAGNKIKPDKVERFNEFDCSIGSLGVLNGLEVMPRVMGFLN